MQCFYIKRYVNMKGTCHTQNLFFSYFNTLCVYDMIDSKNMVSIIFNVTNNLLADHVFVCLLNKFNSIQFVPALFSYY